MKKRIMLSMLSVVASCAIIGGATFAYFADSATTSANTFTSGTIDIDSYRAGGDTIPGPMFYTTPEEGKTPTDPSYNGQKPTGYWAPGDTNIRSMVVYNKGSLDAVLNQVYAQVIEDTDNMASKMNVAIYNVIPTHLPNGEYFSPLAGDDNLDPELIEYINQQIYNSGIIAMNTWFPVTNLAQQFVEAQVPANCNLLWNGKLNELTTEYKPFNNSLTMNAEINPLGKKGCLLVFVVQLDKDQAGNEVKGGSAKFAFSLNAQQKIN